MGKRKGDDVLISSVSTVVVPTESTSHTITSALTTTNDYDNIINTAAASSSFVTGGNSKSTTTSSTSSGTTKPPLQSSAVEWFDSASYDHKLRVVRETLKLNVVETVEADDNNDDDDDDDFVIREINQCHGQFRQSFQNQQTKLLEDSKTIQQSLQNQLTEQHIIVEKEMNTLSVMEDDVQDTQQQCDSIRRDISNLNQRRENLERSIIIAMEEANQEVEQIDIVEEARKNQVPKLKHQISMYATITGIKWDYSDDDDHDNMILQGEASLPSKEVIRSFKIDPHEYSKFEVAQKLWGVLDPSNE